ncbi:Programmed cell death protein 2-like [Geodia barretti]|uniref:Programmed cell death protein 2-like n=1 Tax=Geodia barretti TaxID=519541 RepID=A0AA35WWE5_GEOBA|nr:Programmed cell death protein 2-like [Geodia barretti]
MTTCVSNVLLGVSDAPCNGPVLSPYENKIGGYPDFFRSSSLPALPCCTLCGGFLQLLVQVYCPLDDSVNHRLLHLYCCTQSTCNRTNEGWLALRSEVKDSAISDVSGSTTNTTGTTIETTPGTTGYHSRPLGTKQPPTVNKWCSGADDWGEEEEGTDQT